MILIIAAKRKVDKHLCVAACVKCFLLSMVKVFLFSKLPKQQSEKSLTTVSSLNKFQQKYLGVSPLTIFVRKTS